MKHKRVQAGDGVAALSASTWNSLCDLAEQFEAARPFDATAFSSARRHSGIITIINDTGADLTAGSVVSARGFVWPPVTKTTGTSPGDTATDREIRVASCISEIAMYGQVPDDNDARPCVTLEPIPEDAAGLAMFHGVCPARVRMGGQGGTIGFATTISGVTDALKWVSYGNVRVIASTLATQRTVSGDDVGWCYVQLGIPQRDTFLVKLKRNGGANGDATTDVSYAYDMWPYNDDTSDSTRKIPGGPFEPFRIINKARYNQASDNSVGLAANLLADVGGSLFALLTAYDETLDPGAC